MERYPAYQLGPRIASWVDWQGEMGLERVYIVPAMYNRIVVKLRVVDLTRGKSNRRQGVSWGALPGSISFLHSLSILPKLFATSMLLETSRSTGHVHDKSFLG